MSSTRFLGAVLLVSGTTIGAGMLALPITTGLAGFIPALCIMTAIWLFMMLTAYYLLEVNLRMPGESNIISMMGKTLKLPGQIAAWVVYLILLYALVAAYMVGCSDILSDWLPLGRYVWPVVVFLIFATFVYFGTSVIDWLNRLLMTGLIVAYACTIGFGCCRLQLPLLQHIDWSYLLPSLSVVLTTFGYHIIIPTLTTYLDHNPRQLKWAIFVGSLIPFLIYVAWQILVMGVVPVEGELSLIGARETGTQISIYLQKLIGNPWVAISIRIFAFFAIVTSLLGVSLSLHDFLADGLKVKNSALGKLGIILLTFFPPLFFTLFYPKGFIVALEYAGICVAILLGLFPVLMAWSERYCRSESWQEAPFVVCGGKALLIIAVILSIGLVGFEIFL